MIDPGLSNGNSQAVLVQDSVAAAAKALQAGELDAAFFVAAFDADYIQSLLRDRNVSLLKLRPARGLSSPIPLPGLRDRAGGYGKSGPERSGRGRRRWGFTAMLVVRKDFHPALVPLVLMAATRVHGKGDELSEPGEFPSEAYCDFPVNEDAKAIL